MDPLSEKVTLDRIRPELVFTTSRSSGPGGQNVNKVNTKVTVRWDVERSRLLTEEQRALLKAKLSLTTEGVLVVQAQEKRSQADNRAEALLKLSRLLAKVYARKKPRKATRPGKAAVEKRLQHKKKQSEKKKWRGEW